MIEVQVRVDDDVHIVRVHAVVLQALDEVRPVERVNVALLGIEFVARSCFDQNGLSAGIHQQAVHRQRDAVPSVRGHFLFPQGTRDHAEHGAAVQSQMPRYENMKFQLA